MCHWLVCAAKMFPNCSELEYKWAPPTTTCHPFDSEDSGFPEGLDQLNNRMLQFLRWGSRTWPWKSSLQLLFRGTGKPANLFFFFIKKDSSVILRNLNKWQWFKRPSTFGESAGPFAVILTNCYGLSFDHETAVAMKLDHFTSLVGATPLNVSVFRVGWWFANHFCERQ